MKLGYGHVQDNVFEKYQDYFGLFSSIHFPYDEAQVKIIIYQLFNYSKIDIRNQEKIIEQARTVHRIACAENNSDYSILLFELIVSIFLYLAPDTELRVIPEINRATYPSLESYLGRDLLKLLKRLEDSTIRNEPLEVDRINGYLRCEETINLSYHYLYSLFSKETKYSDFWIEGSEEELEICRRFIAMKRLLT